MAAAAHMEEEFWEHLHRTFWDNIFWITGEGQKIIPEIDNYVGRLTRPQRKYLWGKVNKIVKVIDETKQIGLTLFEWYSPYDMDGRRISEMINWLNSERKWFNNLLKPDNLYYNPVTPLRKKGKDENEIPTVVQLAHEWQRYQEELMKANKVGSINPYIICK